MARSDDPYRSDADVSEGTHPLAMVSIVGGILSSVTCACAALQPFMAVAAKGVAGLLAVGAGAIVLVRVAQGRYHPSNKVQAGIGTALGLVGLACAAVWAALMSQYGAMPFVAE